MATNHSALESLTHRIDGNGNGLELCLPLERTIETLWNYQTVTGVERVTIARVYSPFANGGRSWLVVYRSFVGAELGAKETYMAFNYASNMDAAREMHASLKACVVKMFDRPTVQQA